MQNSIDENFSAAQANDAPFDEVADMARLSSLKTLRRNTGLTMDFWADLTERLDQSALNVLVSSS
jgi:hypothetical protein